MDSWPTTGDELRDWLDDNDLTSRDAGELLRLRDTSARAVRDWCSDKTPMPFAAWFTLRTLVEGKGPKL